jgi:hypothetical protein
MTAQSVLNQLMEAYVQASVPVLAKHHLPLTQDMEVTIDPSGATMGGQSTFVPDYWSYVTRVEPELLALPETDALLNAIGQDVQLQKAFLTDGSGSLRPSAEHKQWLQGQRLTQFLYQYLDRIASYPPTFQPTVFQDLYIQWIQFLLDPATMTIYWLVQMGNLQLAPEIDVIDLEPGVRLRRATFEEKAQEFKASFPLPAPQSFMTARRNLRFAPIQSMDRLAPPAVFLEIEGQHAPGTYDTATPYRLAHQILRSLRLISPAQVGVHSILYSNPNPFDENTAPRMAFDEGWPRLHLFGEGYLLTQELALALRDIWPKAAATPAHDGLALALRRFDDSYRRTHPEDRLLDYWIALEALFLADESQELKYRAANRIACYLEPIGQRRLDTFTTVSDSYKLRSTVAHGTTIKPKHGLPTVVDQTGEILRRVLRKCLEENTVPKGTKLDERLLLGDE